MGLSEETRFSFAYGLACFGLRVYDSASAFAWTFGKALPMQECAIVFEIVPPSRKKRQHCKVSVKELEAGVNHGVFVSFVSSRALTREGETHMDMMSLLSIYTPVFAR